MTKPQRWASRDLWTPRHTLLEALAHEYPRRPHEGSLHYIQRLNVLAGYVRREDAGLISPSEDVEAGRIGTLSYGQE